METVECSMRGRETMFTGTFSARSFKQARKAVLVRRKVAWKGKRVWSRPPRTRHDGRDAALTRVRVRYKVTKMGQATPNFSMEHVRCRFGCGCLSLGTRGTALPAPVWRLLGRGRTAGRQSWPASCERIIATIRLFRGVSSVNCTQNATKSKKREKEHA